VVQIFVDKDPAALEVSTRDGLMPLHVAVKSRPLDFVQFLFGLCPRALQERAKDGLLPLHIAAQSDATLDVIYFLARTWPKAVDGG
jgi:ankyrin repeat protein